jgi:hypothetical protein
MHDAASPEPEPESSPSNFSRQRVQNWNTCSEEEGEGLRRQYGDIIIPLEASSGHYSDQLMNNMHLPQALESSPADASNADANSDYTSNADANSDYTSNVSDHTTEGERLPHVPLTALQPLKGRWRGFFAIIDTGGTLSVLSEEVASQVLSIDQIAKIRSNHIERMVKMLGDITVVLYGPVKLRFRQLDPPSRKRYKASFYVAPNPGGKYQPDAILSCGLSVHMGLVEVAGSNV